LVDVVIVGAVEVGCSRVIGLNCDLTLGKVWRTGIGCWGSWIVLEMMPLGPGVETMDTGMA